MIGLALCILYTGNCRPKFIFAPFALVVSGQVLDWTINNVSLFSSLNTTVSRGTQNKAKLVASEEGRKEDYCESMLSSDSLALMMMFKIS